MKKQTKTQKSVKKVVKKTQKATKKAVNKFESLTKKELASKLYDLKKKTGANLTPVGSKQPLTRAEFTKRYLNGVGGTKGFKKDELVSLAKRYQNIANRMEKPTTTKPATKKLAVKKTVNKPAKKTVAKKK